MKKQKGYIYKIYNNINDYIYIGQTIQAINNRFYQHKYDAKKGSTNTLHLAMMKYGEENFFIELIEECDIELLDEREIYWISYYDSYNNGYNMTKGGSNIYSNPQNRRIKIDDLYLFQLWDEGKSCKEIIEITGYSKTAVRNHLMKYENYSVEESEKRGFKEGGKTKEKEICQWSLKGEYIAKYASAREAEKETEIGYKNISAVLNKKAKTAGGYIWTFSNDKPALPKKQILQYDMDNNLINIYSSKAEAARALNIDASGIGKAIRGVNKTCGGYIWRENDS